MVIKQGTDTFNFNWKSMMWELEKWNESIRDYDIIKITYTQPYNTNDGRIYSVATATLFDGTVLKYSKPFYTDKYGVYNGFNEALLSIITQIACNECNIEYKEKYDTDVSILLYEDNDDFLDLPYYQALDNAVYYYKSIR